ncbi:MAG: thioesterase family protein [Oceanicaulis sp.]
MSLSLADLIKTAEITGDGLLVEPGPGWTQGRTAYGGLTAALCLAAAERKAAPGRPLRSAMISFVGPSAGRLEVTSELLREGRTASAVRTRLSSEAGIGVEAVFTFSGGRDSVLDYEGPALPAGAAPPGPDAAPLVFPDGAPEFTRRFEFVWASDTAPFSGASEPVERAWVRHADPESRTHPLALLCLADALPPAACTMLQTFAPLSSMTWMIDFLGEPPETEEGWWLLEARADQTERGHSSQDMTIWNAVGRCVAKGRQTVAIFV